MHPSIPSNRQLSNFLGEFRDDAKVSLTIQYLAKHPRTRASELKRLCGIANISDVAAVSNRKLRPYGFMIAPLPSPIPYLSEDGKSTREWEWSIFKLNSNERNNPDIKPTTKDPLWKKRREWLLDQAGALADEINGLIAKTRMGLPAE